MKNNCNINSPCYRGCYPIGPTGPRGVQGEVGPTGPTGPASAEVTVGDTKTSEPGSLAEVYATGTDNNVVLNFVIPRGEVGPVPNFSVGSVVTSEAGTDATVTITPIYEDNSE